VSPASIRELGNFGHDPRAVRASEILANHGLFEFSNSSSMTGHQSAREEASNVFMIPESLRATGSCG
jgi:hypothetical protein